MGENMVLRSGLVTAVLAYLYVYMSSIHPAAADTIWTLEETACSPIEIGGCDNGHLSLPLVIGSIEGSGTYDSGPFGEFSESGDFTLTLSSFVFGSAAAPYCAFIDTNCGVHINVTSTDAGVTGDFNFENTQGPITYGFNGLTFGG